MQNRIENVNTIIVKNNRPMDTQAETTREAFYDKYILMEEMIEVMIDDKDYKTSALQSLTTSYTMICCGIISDQINRMKKKLVS